MEKQVLREREVYHHCLSRHRHQCRSVLTVCNQVCEEDGGAYGEENDGSNGRKNLEEGEQWKE